MTPQAQTIYEHMKKNRAITQNEAYEQMEGIGIVKSMRTGKNRFGASVRYAEYRLGGRV